MQTKRAAGRFLHKKCAKRALESFHKVQQLDRRKLAESLLYLLLLPLQKNPACHLVQLTAHEVNAPADRAERRIGLAPEGDVPAFLAPLQLPHILTILH